MPVSYISGELAQAITPGRRSASPYRPALLRQSNHAWTPPWATTHDSRHGARRAVAGL